MARGRGLATVFASHKFYIQYLYSLKLNTTLFIKELYEFKSSLHVYKLVNVHFFANKIK